MRNCKSLIIVAALSVALMGCQMNKQTSGGLLGAGLGAWGGSKIGGGKGQLAAVAGGAILGLFVGSSIGQSLDRIDQMSASRTMQTALERAPVGRAVSWQNPDRRRQTYGSVTPTRTYQHHRTRRYCREYQQEITIGGRTERAYGKACRQPDGSWKIVNDQTSAYQPTYRPQTTYVTTPRYNRRHGGIYSTSRPCYDRRFC